MRGREKCEQADTWDTPCGAVGGRFVAARPSTVSKQPPTYLFRGVHSGVGGGAFLPGRAAQQEEEEEEGKVGGDEEGKGRGRGTVHGRRAWTEKTERAKTKARSPPAGKRLCVGGEGRGGMSATSECMGESSPTTPKTQGSTCVPAKKKIFFAQMEGELVALHLVWRNGGCIGGGGRRAWGAWFRGAGRCGNKTRENSQALVWVLGGKEEKKEGSGLTNPARPT